MSLLLRLVAAELHRNAVQSNWHVQDSCSQCPVLVGFAVIRLKIPVADNVPFTYSVPETDSRWWLLTIPDITQVQNPYGHIAGLSRSNY